jgi:hypothetical protein
MIENADDRLLSNLSFRKGIGHYVTNCSLIQQGYRRYGKDKVE